MPATFIKDLAHTCVLPVHRQRTMSFDTNQHELKKDHITQLYSNIEVNHCTDGPP